MQIQDYNQPSAQTPIDASDNSAPGLDTATARDLELALLKAQIEHLELVVETARSLMTSNQDRLLRRLHDLPREMVALTARMNRLDNQKSVRIVA